jgi:hypothetical protein
MVNVSEFRRKNGQLPEFPEKNISDGIFYSFWFIKNKMKLTD